MHRELSETGLSADTIEKIQTVFSHYLDIESVSVYGSRAKGNFQKGSDIDLTIMSDTLEGAQLIKLEVELDDLLLPYKIDLSLFRNIQNSDLIEHINRVGIELYHR